MIWPPVPRLAVLALGILMSSTPLRLAAQDACYCLEHVATGQLYRGCSLFKGPSDAFATAIDCRSSDVGGEGEAVKDFAVTSTWRKITEGEDRCGVCRPEARSTIDVPRGDEDEDQ